MVKEIKEIKSKIDKADKRPVLTFLVFLALSAGLWLLIKLSEDYTTQTTFRVIVCDAPADLLITAPEQTVKMSLNTDGFHTLKHRLIREAKRNVSVSLEEVPYRLENDNTYSFSSQYVAEKVANRLGANASSITVNDAKIYFNMEPLLSKVVPVVLRSDIKPLRQFGLYGIPVIEPATVTIYGPREVIDTVRSVKTALLVKAGVSEGFSETVALDLCNGALRSNVQSVQVGVDVEKYTETDIKVPISVSDSLQVRLFPDAVSVKCLVAIRDFANLSPEGFHAMVDTAQFHARKPLLDVKLVACPNGVQVLETSPEKVEYVIVQ